MILTLENEFLRVALNTFGGAIESMVNKRTGTDHCWHYDPAVWPRRTAICFPICSALRGGIFTHHGRTYALPMHGFLRERNLGVISCGQQNAVMEFISDAATRACYPFDFRFELEQRLEENTLVVIYRVSNPGKEPLPFSIGSHYTYALPAAPQCCRYRFSAPQSAPGLLLNGGVVQGKGSDVFGGASELPMNISHGASSRIFETADLSTDYIAIGTDAGDFTRVRYRDFPYTVLWHPVGPDSPFACIEAWAGMADYEGSSGEITEKKGIQTAFPGETKTFMQRITAMETIH